MASFSAKEKEVVVVVAAGENAAQDKLCPMRMAVVVKTVRVMVIVVSAAMMQLLTMESGSKQRAQGSGGELRHRAERG